MSLQNKIDFAIILNVKNANPNGDPLNGNRPRTDYDGFGEITDVCLKRKIRDRLQEMGYDIFVQTKERQNDSMTSLKNRAESEQFGLGKDAFKDEDKAIKGACKKWIDVRTFGQVLAFSNGNKNNKNNKDNKDTSSKSVSIAIRGPMTIQSAFSIAPINVISTQITKSVNSEGDGIKKSADTMGMKHRVDKAVYVVYGAITPQLAERTGFSNEDADIIKAVLPKLFEGDASSARPEGSMVVEKLIWWQHNSRSGQYSSAKVHQSLKINEDGSFLIEELDGLKAEKIDGF